MRVKVWFSSLLFVLAFVVVSLLVSCGQDEAVPSASADQTSFLGPTLTPPPSNTPTSVSEPAIDAGSTSSDDPKSSGARLATALQMLNPDLSDPQPRNIGFTDWSLMKEYMDLQNLDGTSNDEERRDFVIGLGETQAVGAGEWLSSDSYRSTWGFDVDWEVGGDSFGILKFREGFDFEEWRHQLLSQSYIEEDSYREAIVLSTEDLSVPFRRRNLAFLPEDNLLVLSEEVRSESMLGALDIVDLIKEDAKGLMTDEAILDTAAQLGDVAAALISLNRCSRLSLQPATYLGEVQLPPAVVDNINQYIDEKGVEILFSAHDFEVFGIGYRYDDGAPIVVMVFHYADPADARADLGVRREVIANGPSTYHRSQGYADLHTVTDSYVEGNNLVLELLPAQNKPSVQFEMVNNWELFFTMCAN